MTSNLQQKSRDAIAKILVSGLREILHTTISEAQSAFIQGRKILDVVLEVDEI